MPYPFEPTPTPIGARLRERTQPLAPDDDSHGFAHAWLSEALGALFRQAQEVGDPDGDLPPLSVLLDPELCPAWALPWLAQFVGIRIPGGTTEATARSLIREVRGFHRGTVAAMRSAMNLYLAPDATVYFRERDAGDPYRLEVVVQSDDVPKTDLDWPLNIVTNPSSEVTNGWGTASGATATPVNLVPNPTFEAGVVGAAVPSTVLSASSSQSTSNLVTNPSGEAGVPTCTTASSPSAGNPATTLVDSTAWARVGTHSTRVTIVRDDATSIIYGRTAIGAAGIPVTPGNWYAIRTSHRHASSAPGTAYTNQRTGIYWYTAGGAAASTAAASGPAVVAAIGQIVDGYLIAQAPADAAFAAPAALGSISPATVGNALVVDCDAFMLVDLGATAPPSSGSTTNPADVPPYFDGDTPGFKWNGAANASTSSPAAATVVYDNNWPRPIGTQSVHYKSTANNGQNFVCRTPTGNLGFPVVGGKTYGARASVRVRAPVAGSVGPQKVGIRVYWFNAAGAAASTSSGSIDDLRTITTTPAELDLVTTAVAPADAAFCSVSLYIQNTVNPQYLVDIDADHYLAVDMAAYPAVPAYFDGSMVGWKWSGAANASTSLPTTARARENVWAAVGAWSCHYVVTRDDGATCTVRTESGTDQANAGRFPINFTHYYAFRLRMRLRSTCQPVDRIYVNAFWFLDAGGVTQGGASATGPAVSNPATGVVYDLVCIAKPSDNRGQYVGIRALLDPPAAPTVMDCDVDAVAMYDLGSDFAGPTGTDTDPADVPPYVDGTLPGCVWNGTAHASTSKRVATTHLVQDALTAQKPGGIILSYRTIVGWDYQAMTAAGGTYLTLKSQFATYRLLSEG